MYISALFLLFSLFTHASVLEKTIEASWQQDDFIRAQERRINAATLDRYARFLPNNPAVSFTQADNASWSTYGISLNMGLPGKAFLLSRVDREVLSAEKYEMAAKKNELAQFLLGQYVDCATANELMGVLEDAKIGLETLMGTLTARYEMGQATQAERIGIELQHRQALNEFNTNRDKSGVACGKFQEILERYELLGFTPKDFVLPDDLTPALISQMGRGNADLIRAENDIKVSRARFETAFWNNLPDLTLGYYRNYYRNVVASPIVPVQWTNTFMVGINLPIFYPFFNGVDLQRARAELMITERRAAMRKIQSEQTIMNARNEYLRNRKILEKLRKHDLPMAETMVDSTVAAYKSGKLGFSELILAKRMWLDLRKEEVYLKQALLNARLNCLMACDSE